MTKGKRQGFTDVKGEFRLKRQLLYKLNADRQWELVVPTTESQQERCKRGLLAIFSRVCWFVGSLECTPRWRNVSRYVSS